jgi:hypothetical protein
MTTFATPDIASAVGADWYLIVMARITAVHPAKGGSRPKTRISFHVQQFLRGESDLEDFEVESDWTPDPASQDAGTIVIDGQPRSTVLDRSEPRQGDLYLLGYPPPNDRNRKSVFIVGAVDMQDPNQVGLIREVEKFLAIESAAGSGFEPYLEALDSTIPWVRQIAVQRLSFSNECSASPVCAQRFSSVVRRQMQSPIPDERLEASNWMVWVESVSRSESAAKKWTDGMPILPDSLIRQLWSASIEDRNVDIGDEAFARREMFDFNRSGKPGDCIVIVPALRKSAHWPGAVKNGEPWPNPLPVNLPLNSSTSCIPAPKP